MAQKMIVSFDTKEARPAPADFDEAEELELACIYGYCRCGRARRVETSTTTLPNGDIEKMRRMICPECGENTQDPPLV